MKGKKKVIIGIIAAVVVVGIVVAVVLGMRRGKSDKTINVGNATESDEMSSYIRIELAADDGKAVELALVNARIDFRALPGGTDETPEYYVETRRGGVRLSVRPSKDLRGRPRRDRHGREELRLDAAAVETLLMGSEP